METVSQRFLRYVAFDTQSDEFSESCPSTKNQLALGKALVAEMQDMGISDAYMDTDGYVYGTVPGDPGMPTIGLIAHMDTAPAFSGTDVKPRVLMYNGGDIVLNKEKSIVLRTADFESLDKHIGKHLIVTDGTTLLGADNKAGIAEILTAAEMMLHSDKKHATLRIGFTPDEEIGRGADRFNVEAFGADYAYTVDGGALGELEYENFNAAGATVEFHGISIHPGSAKNKMVNAQLIAMEFHSLLPVHQRPESTEGYEGFFHLTDMQGTEETAVLRYIIRDHDMKKFTDKKSLMEEIAAFLNAKYGAGAVDLKVQDSYFNMREKIEPCMYIIDRAVSSMRKMGIEPKITPIRGGTDGARLSFMGLPCPNLCTGGENFHGKYEYIPIEDMELISKLLVTLLQDA
ncbi:MAG: peptidase T [Oscillospiraceae bacterium]|nr:peptidase T [Oscillospiraceae bacterium]